jgi:quercetin dioxygenase-like cupin family protein
MSKTLERLEQLTDELPILNGPMEYKTDKGTAIGLLLIKTNEISVTKMFCSKDTVFPQDMHDERKWILIYNGKCIYENCSNGIKKELNNSDFVCIEPGTKHKLIFLQDTRMILITIPTSRGVLNDK